MSAYGLYAGLGLVCALFGVAVMRAVGIAEGLVARSLPLPRWLRPAVGGVLLAGLAMLSPQTLSSGHGALRYDLQVDLGIELVLALIVLKSLASIVSLGFGFRGGMFFASLFLGSLVGKVYAVSLAATHWPSAMLDPTVAALVGMSAVASAVIGGPMTMSFLALETTGDFAITAAALTASMLASVVARETFGYSFSTWRLHLRGETIRSANDVGWLRNLTAGGMMRGAPKTIPAEASVAEARRRFPLGSAKQVVAVDEGGRYAGLVSLADLYASPDAGQRPVAELADQTGAALRPEMAIKLRSWRPSTAPRPTCWWWSTRKARLWAWCPKPTPPGATPTNWRKPAAT